MAMLRQCAHGTVIGCVLFLQVAQGWCVPDQTMSVTPSATSGSTILASDENTRNSNISTPFNAHSHTDLTQTSTPLNIGASSGRSTIGDASVVLEGATNDASETTITVTDPTADRTITIPNETGSLITFSNANTQDVNIIFEGATADAFETTVTVTDPTADRTITIPDQTFTLGTMASNLFTFSRTDAAGSGTVTVAHGLALIPTGLIVFCEQDSQNEYSFGLADDDGPDEGGFAVRNAAALDNTLIAELDDGVDSFDGVVDSVDATNVTITWSGAVPGTATVDCVGLAMR